MSFKEYVSSIEFFSYDPSLMLVIEQTEAILVYDLEENQIQQVLSCENGFNFVCSLKAENIIVASTLSGYLNIYELKDVFELVNRISLEDLYINFMRKKESKTIFFILPLFLARHWEKNRYNLKKKLLIT